MNLDKTSLKKIWNTSSLSFAFFAYVLIVLIATAQGAFAPPKFYWPGAPPYITYNNFIIFKHSFSHLLQGKDIYQRYPEEYWDVYKYSPAFVLCFGLLAWMPNAVGLLLWNGINSLCLFAGIRLLPGLDDRRKTLLLLFCLLEMLVSIQNDQSNGLCAGLTVLALALAERSKYFLSTLCVVFAFYIKIYGGLAFIFYLFYPGKLRLMGWSVCWMLFFAVLPLTVVDTHQLVFLYRSWLNLLSNDRSASLGLSVMGILQSWFHWNVTKNVVTLAGMVLLLLPLVHIRRYKEYSFRLLYLASALIWMVIFNHKAESPTFIIAISGIGLWYFSQKPDKLNSILLILAFLLISMSASDLVPSYIRHEIVWPYAVKAVMPIVIWCKIVYEQLTLRYRPAFPVEPWS